MQGAISLGLAAATSLGAPGVSAPSTAILARHPDRPRDCGRVAGRIGNAAPCTFAGILDQSPGRASNRAGVTGACVNRRDPNRSGTVGSRGVTPAGSRLTTRDVAEPIETVGTITPSDPATGQQHGDASGSVCAGGPCRGPTEHETIALAVPCGGDPLYRRDSLLSDLRGPTAACSSQN